MTLGKEKFASDFIVGEKEREEETLDDVEPDSDESFSEMKSAES